MEQEQLNNVGGEVTPTPTEQPFRVFKTQEDFDNFAAHLMRKAEERALKNVQIKDGESTMTKTEYDKMYRKDIEANAIAEYERKLKLTEQERFDEERRKYEQEYREREIVLNRREAQVLLAQAGFDEEEMEVYLENVSEDREASLGRIERICNSRKSMQEKLLSKWQSELQTANPTVNIGNGQTITAEQARNMTIRERTELKKNNPALYASLFKS